MQPVTDVEYTGLTDTAVGFTGSTTLDSSVDPGSPLPLVIGPNRNMTGNQQRRVMATYDLWDNPSSVDTLQLSGVSDPPFASAMASTPKPYAAPRTVSMFNAFSAQSKFGSTVATLLGNHPKTIVGSPSQLAGNQSRVLTHTPASLTGGNTVVLAVIVFAMALLLWRAE
jgi:hypothetical protein